MARSWSCARRRRPAATANPLDAPCPPLHGPGVTARYPYVHVDVEPELAETLTEVLFSLDAQGVEERDQGTLAKGDTPGVTTLVASFASREEAEACLDALDDEWGARIHEIVGDDWRDAWKEHFKPFSLTRSIVVRPPWEEYAARQGEQVLTLEPGRAFGTGLHATTSLVARALERDKARIEKQPILDVGTGSGILAFVALLLGAGHVVCVDNDEDVLPVVRENADRNGLTEHVSTSSAPLSELAGFFPIVLANIEARVLIPLAGEIAAKVGPEGTLILSGILTGQEDDVAAAYPGFSVEVVDREGEWVSLTLRRSA